MCRVKEGRMVDFKMPTSPAFKRMSVLWIDELFWTELSGWSTSTTGFAP